MNYDFIIYVYSKIIHGGVFLHSAAFSTTPKNNICFFKFQIPEKKQFLQNTYKHSCALNLSSSSICVSISSFSENKREGGEEGEIQRTE